MTGRISDCRPLAVWVTALYSRRQPPSAEILAAAERYPWANEYTLLPGPNSNTFPAWIGLQVKELELEAANGSKKRKSDEIE